MFRKTKNDSLPNWARRIRHLLSGKNISQADLADQLGVSAATVSRWLSGRNEPAPQAYVALGNLAGFPDGVYFWERAGVRLTHTSDISLKQSLTSSVMNVDEFNVVAGKKVSSMLRKETMSIVAIPLLKICAYADETSREGNVSIAEAEVEDVITAPPEWCPHPEDMVSMYVCGDSMFPTLQDNAVIVVDTASNDRKKLDHQIVVAQHRDKGLKVARLQHLSDCVLLVPSSHKAMPIDISSTSKWKILGQVLWWVTRDQPNDTALAPVGAVATG